MEEHFGAVTLERRYAQALGQLETDWLIKV